MSDNQNARGGGPTRGRGRQRGAAHGNQPYGVPQQGGRGIPVVGGGGQQPLPLNDVEVKVERMRVVRMGCFEGRAKYMLIYRNNSLPTPAGAWNEESCPFINPRYAYYKGPGGMECWTVYILSFLYLGVPLVDHIDEVTESLAFRREVPVQCGSHLFVNRYGNLSMHEGLLDGVLERRLDNKAPITAVYPNIRLRVDEQNPANNRYELLLGHVVEPVKRPADYVTGLRYYHADWFPNATIGNTQNRYPFGLVAGGVYELPVGQLLDVPAVHPQEGVSYFAIYVCVGAKLIVVDNYHTVGTPGNAVHHRKLVQQGGVFIVSGVLGFGIPITTQECVPYGQAVQNNILLPQRVGQPIPENPVVFIGASDSKFESIAWKLFIRGNHDGTRQCYLYGPEGGRLAAIEDWDDGIEEIRARHHYEQLYKASLRVNRTPLHPNATVEQLLVAPFQVHPNPDIINKILCQGPDNTYLERQVLVNYPQALQESHVPLQPQFVPYRYQYFGGAQNRPAVPFVPFIWPLTLVGNQVNPVSNQMDYFYEIWKYNDKDYQRSVNLPLWGKTHQNVQSWYGLSAAPKEFPIYEVTKHTDHTLFNGKTNYIGLDGWLYEVVLNPANQPTPVGTFNMKYYEEKI